MGTGIRSEPNLSDRVQDLQLTDEHLHMRCGPYNSAPTLVAPSPFAISINHFVPLESVLDRARPAPGKNAWACAKRIHRHCHLKTLDELVLA